MKTLLLFIAAKLSKSAANGVCHSVNALSTSALSPSNGDNCFEVYSTCKFRSKGEGQSPSKADEKCLKTCVFRQKAAILKVEHTKDKSSKRAVLREIDGMAAVRNLPGAMRMFACFELNDKVLFVFERLFLDLYAARAAFAALSAAKRSRVFIELAKTLSAAHKRRITHGDIKPQNIAFVNASLESAKFIDWGLAATNGNQRALGTLVYIPPETSCNGFRLNQTTAMDVWMFGATVLEMLSPNALDIFSEALARPFHEFRFTKALYARFQIEVRKLFGPKEQNMYNKMIGWLAYEPENRANMERVVADLIEMGPNFFDRKARNLSFLAKLSIGFERLKNNIKSIFGKLFSSKKN